MVPLYSAPRCASDERHVFGSSHNGLACKKKVKLLEQIGEGALGETAQSDTQTVALSPESL